MRIVMINVKRLSTQTLARITHEPEGLSSQVLGQTAMEHYAL